MIGDPTTLNEPALTTAHVALVQLEGELRAAGRTEAADAIAYADLVVLAARAVLPTLGRWPFTRARSAGGPEREQLERETGRGLVDEERWSRKGG